jgi:RNA polymerase sigma factor (sigma-70 family)
MKTLVYLWGLKPRLSSNTKRDFNRLRREFSQDAGKLAAAYALKYQNHVVTQNEIEQEAILGLLKAHTTFDAKKGASFRTHALNCMRWAVQDYLKSVARDSKYIDRSKDAYEEGEKPSDEVETSDSAQLDILRQGLGNLSERQREAILLRFHSDQKLKGVSARMGISIARAGKLVKDALKNLRNYMEPRMATTL